MTARRLLYPTLVAAIVLLAVAIPAFADEGDVTMWVHRARLAHTGRSSGGTDSMVAYIHVRDATNDMVVGASVKGTWTLPDGTTVSDTQPTEFQGIAKFYLWKGKGTYTFCVDSVAEDERTYDSSLDRETCPTFTAY